MDSLNNSFKCSSCGNTNKINLNNTYKNVEDYNRTSNSFNKRLKNFDYVHLNELEKLLVDFTVDILSKKPNQLYLYANEYFANKLKIQSTTNCNMNDLDQEVVGKNDDEKEEQKQQEITEKQQETRQISIEKDIEEKEEVRELDNEILKEDNNIERELDKETIETANEKEENDDDEDDDFDEQRHQDNINSTSISNQTKSNISFHLLLLNLIFFFSVRL